MTTENMNIYELGLHESTIIECPACPRMRVTRVASGWIYDFQNSVEGIFVPFDNHFMGKDIHD